jgi:hypothetical protein
MRRHFKTQGTAHDIASHAALLRAFGARQSVAGVCQPSAALDITTTSIITQSANQCRPLLVATVSSSSTTPASPSQRHNRDREGGANRRRCDSVSTTRLSLPPPCSQAPAVARRAFRTCRHILTSTSRPSGLLAADKQQICMIAPAHLLFVACIVHAVINACM